MSHYKYLIVGSGMTADAAVDGIRQVDPEGAIGLIGAEVEPPYNRPPLTKGLWQGKPFEKIWRGTPTKKGVTLHLGRTVQSLMNMESGIRYSHGKSPFDDMARFWLSPDIRKELKSVKPCSYGDGYFFYNDIHLHLLNRIIDSRISDLSVDINHNLWQYLKPTANALFCMDSLSKGFLKMDGGMVIAPYDLAKFGLLYANDGVIHGNQVLDGAWCANLKNSKGVRTDSEYWDLYRRMNHSWYPILREGRTYYKNFWWGFTQADGPNDIYAMGILGQFVYVSTRNNVVIVRQGNSWGVKGWWPYIFEELAAKV